jgi:hypothetical protein
MSTTAVSYHSMSMAVLKVMLESHGCDTTGKKKVMEERLEAKMNELQTARRSTALRTQVVSAASTSELDRASAEIRAWHANGSALAKRLAVALDGTESVLQQQAASASAAGGGASAPILAQARCALEAIQALQSRRAHAEPYRQAVQACTQLSVHAESAAESARGGLNESCPLLELLQRNDVRSDILGEQNLGIVELYCLRRVSKVCKVWATESLRRCVIICLKL